MYVMTFSCFFSFFFKFSFIMSVSTLRHRSPGSEHVVRQFLYHDRRDGSLVGVPRADTVGDASATPVPPAPGSSDKTAVKVLIAFVVILSVAVIGKHPQNTSCHRPEHKSLILSKH